MCFGKNTIIELATNINNIIDFISQTFNIAVGNRQCIIIYIGYATRT